MPDTAPAKKATSSRAKVEPDMDKARGAARAVGDKLEGERQERIDRRDNATIWERLAAPFPADELEKLPKVLSARDDNKGRCEAGSRYSADGHHCGGWHARAVHLDYVGHAGITMRLNNVLGPNGWTLEPYAETPEGMPLLWSKEFWVKLSIYDPETQTWVTKMGVGDDYRTSKEAIGDALRNAAMRFGVATYLWSKSEAALALKIATDDAPPPAREERQERRQEPATAPPDQAPASPVPDAERPPHVLRVDEAIRAMTPEQRTSLATWWDLRAQEGHLPTREHLLAITPEQAAFVLETCAQITAPEEPPF